MSVKDHRDCFRPICRKDGAAYHPQLTSTDGTMTLAFLLEDALARVFLKAMEWEW